MIATNLIASGWGIGLLCVVVVFFFWVLPFAINKGIDTADGYLKQTRWYQTRLHRMDRMRRGLFLASIVSIVWIFTYLSRYEHILYKMEYNQRLQTNVQVFDLNNHYSNVTMGLFVVPVFVMVGIYQIVVRFDANIKSNRICLFIGILAYCIITVPSFFLGHASAFWTCQTLAIPIFIVACAISYLGFWAFQGKPSS
jgi:hypothetical protein